MGDHATAKMSGEGAVKSYYESTREIEREGRETDHTAGRLEGGSTKQERVGKRKGDAVLLCKCMCEREGEEGP